MSNEDNIDEYFAINYNQFQEVFFEEVLNYLANGYLNEDNIPVQSSEQTNSINSNLNLLDGLYTVLRGTLDFHSENAFERVLRESLEESNNHLKRTDEIVDFPIIKYVDCEDKNNYDVKCTICLDEFEDESNISLPECRHIFHTDCIKEWVRYKKECPVCRNEIKK